MDLISKFTKEITLVNLAFKQFLQGKLREHNIDLTFEMMQLLYCLWGRDGINQQELANMTAKDKASVTYVLDNLVKRGLIYRREGADRRNKLIYLTKEGQRMQELVQPWIDSLNDTAKKGVATESLEQLTTVMQQIRQNLSD